MSRVILKIKDESKAEALIAATSIVSKAQLFTYNRKDFRFIKGIALYS